MSSHIVKGEASERQKARAPSAVAGLLVVLLIPAGCSVLEHEHEHEHGAAHDHVHGTVQDTAAGVDPALFMDGAVVASSIEDCTLSDGTQTSCHAITIAGYPVNHNVGPFCPPSTSAGAEEGGIWFDGNAVYDLDGSYILGLATLYGDDHWKLYDEDGKVRITDTPEAFDAAARPDVDPQYQNHCVEGRMEWLENGEPVTSTVLIPVTPVVVGHAQERAHGNLGITLNGVVIAASAPVDAIMGAYTIAAFDDCGGHINPFEGYHLHGARGCSEVGAAGQGETPVFGYAMDGFAIHSPLEGGSAAEGLDECQGHTTEALGYHYHAANAEENAVLSCFTGLTVQKPGGEGRPAGGPPGQRPPNGGR